MARSRKPRGCPTTSIGSSAPSRASRRPAPSCSSRCCSGSAPSRSGSSSSAIAWAPSGCRSRSPPAARSSGAGTRCSWAARRAYPWARESRSVASYSRRRAHRGHRVERRRPRRLRLAPGRARDPVPQGERGGPERPRPARRRRRVSARPARRPRRDAAADRPEHASGERGPGPPPAGRRRRGGRAADRALELLSRAHHGRAGAGAGGKRDRPGPATDPAVPGDSPDRLGRHHRADHLHDRAREDAATSPRSRSSAPPTGRSPASSCRRR